MGKAHLRKPLVLFLSFCALRTLLLCPSSPRCPQALSERSEDSRGHHHWPKAYASSLVSKLSDLFVINNFPYKAKWRSEAEKPIKLSFVRLLMISSTLLFQSAVTLLLLLCSRLPSESSRRKRRLETIMPLLPSKGNNASVTPQDTAFNFVVVSKSKGTAFWNLILII